jgi:hypothetical protein
MNSCDKFIEKLQRELPELCTTTDLVKVGIYKSPQAVWRARKTGMFVDFFKLPTGTIVHPKDGIIQMLKNSKNIAKSKGKESEDHYSRRSDTKSES